MLNKVMLIGNVGTEPEFKATAAGTPLVSLSLATNEKWTDKSGNKQEKTEWHRCTAFGRTAELIGQYVHKGSKVYVEGKITTNQYEKDGEKRYSTEIIVNSIQFLDSKSQAQEPQRAKPQAAPQDDFDDDIPF